jgi:hypothetical protein
LGISLSICAGGILQTQVRPLLERRTKSHTGRRADCASRLAAVFLGLGAAADKASLSLQASRKFSSPRHHPKASQQQMGRTMEIATFLILQSEGNERVTQ